jgi:hypothetical protein
MRTLDLYIFQKECLYYGVPAEDESQPGPVLLPTWSD